MNTHQAKVCPCIYHSIPVAFSPPCIAYSFLCYGVVWSCRRADVEGKGAIAYPGRGSLSPKRVSLSTRANHGPRSGPNAAGSRPTVVGPLACLLGRFPAIGFRLLVHYNTQHHNALCQLSKGQDVDLGPSTSQLRTVKLRRKGGIRRMASLRRQCMAHGPCTESRHGPWA